VSRRHERHQGHRTRTLARKSTRSGVNRGAPQGIKRPRRWRCYTRASPSGILENASFGPEYSTGTSIISVPFRHTKGACLTKAGARRSPLPGGPGPPRGIRPPVKRAARIASSLNCRHAGAHDERDGQDGSGQPWPSSRGSCPHGINGPSGGRKKVQTPQQVTVNEEVPSPRIHGGVAVPMGPGWRRSRPLPGSVSRKPLHHGDSPDRCLPSRGASGDPVKVAAGAGPFAIHARAVTLRRIPPQTEHRKHQDPRSPAPAVFEVNAHFPWLPGEPQDSSGVTRSPRSFTTRHRCRKARIDAAEGNGHVGELCP